MKHYLRYVFFISLFALISLSSLWAQRPEVTEEVERCDITAITAGVQACGPMVDHYTQEIIIDYEYPPEGGQLLVEINGSSEFIAYPVTGSPQSIWLDNLSADGGSVSIFAKFSNDNGCTWNARNLFTAPLDCSVPMAWVQVIHNAPDPNLTPVDVYLTEGFGVDPQSAFFDDVTFKTATPCLPVMPGDYVLGFARGNSVGPEDVLIPFDFTFEAGEKYILMASGVANPSDFDNTVNPDEIGFTVVEFTPGQYESEMPGYVDILAYHGSPDAPVVDVLANDGLPPLVDDIGYKSFAGYVSVPPAAYKLSITPGGDNATVVADFYADISGLGGQAITVFASGFLNPASNNDGPAFGLCAVLVDGTVIDLPPYVECEITGIEAGEYLGCDPDTDTYSQEIIVTYDTDPLEAGDLMIQVGDGEYITVAATASPQTVVLEGLPIDGRGDMQDVKVKFSQAAPPCYYMAEDVFRAPRHCNCDIIGVTPGRQSACDFDTYEYDQQIIVEYINEPSEGTLLVEINGDGNFISYPITGSPQVIVLEDLEGDGEMVDIFVKFSEDNGCTWTARDLYRAPNCRPCEFTAIRAGRQLDCDEDTERYTQELIIEYSEAPTTGDLLVYINGRGPLTYPITGSPQTVAVENLPVDGEYYNVGVNFSDKDCGLRAPDVFRTPEGCRCEIMDIEAGHQTECDPHTNTYDQDIVVYYRNAPATGHILVELNDSDHYLEFDITGSPQTITLEGLESDGEYVDVEVKFSEDRHCQLTEHDVFMAPENCRPEVVNFTLIDAVADTAIAGYDPIPDGAVINLYFMPTDQLSIRANTDPDVVGSVRFHLEGDFDFARIEEVSPYSLFGDINGDYFLPTQAFEAGQSFTLDATPYTMEDAMGLEGDMASVSFSFVNNIPPTAIVEDDTVSLVYPADSVKICGYGMDMDGFIASLDWSQVSGPSTATADTCLRVDTTFVNDTIFSSDTMMVMDSTFTPDTTIVMDTLVDMNGMDSIVVDTTIVIDTTVVTSTVITLDTTVNTTTILDSLVCLKASDLEAGTYVFRLCATDDGGESDCADVVVEVEGPPGPQIESFSLIDADADTAIVAFDPLMDGAEIPISDLPTTNLTVRANTVDGATLAVTQVRLELTGSSAHSQTENFAPYALFGDNNGDFYGRTNLAADGNAFTLSGTAYSNGTEGGSLSVSFSFVSGNRLGLQRGTVEVYPNPSSGVFNILATPSVNSRQAGKARVYVMNSLGQVVHTETIDENIAKDINLSNEAEGLYIIRIEGDDYVATDKILIEK